jgi:uncharacterized damage-inducible protein DinB
MSIRLFYDKWPQYNRRMTEVIASMDSDALAVRPSPAGWPIWATVGHTAGARVYWMCDVLGEPGADRTPFGVGAEMGWEDDLDTPRDAGELVEALQSTFAIIDDCLDRWDPAYLENTIVREYGEVTQTHTYGSVIQRLFSHDSYHCGELSQTLGIHGLPQIDLWRTD